MFLLNLKWPKNKSVYNLFYVIWLPNFVNFLVILGSQHPFSFNVSLC